MVKTISILMSIALFFGLMAGAVVAGGPGALVGGLVGLVLGAGIVTFMAFGGAFGPNFPYWKKRLELDCPHSHRGVEAVFVKNAEDEYTDVEACTRFDPPDAIRCKKGCVHDLNAGDVEAAEAEPGRMPVEGQ